MDGMVEGIALTGDYVKNLSDKHFTIVSVPEYELLPDFKDKSKVKKKLSMMIELAQTKEKLKYYPNLKSQGSITASKGYLLADWVGFAGEFFIAEQMIGDTLKPVIYIKRL